MEREALENGENVRKARSRIDESLAPSFQRGRSHREREATRNGLLERGSAGVSGTDYAVNGYLLRPASGKNASNDYYLNALENFTPTQQNTEQAQSLSDNQGGFSDTRTLDILNQAAWHE